MFAPSEDLKKIEYKIRYYVTKSRTKVPAFGSRVMSQKPFAMGSQMPSMSRQSIRVGVNGGKKSGKPSSKTRKKRI